MLKRTLFICAIFLTATACAQSFSAKDLTGRWYVNFKQHITNIQFLNENKGAFVSSGGLLHNYFIYRSDVKDNIIRIDYTIDINRKKRPNYQHAEIKFLNDSTILYKYGTMPMNADSNTKKLVVFKKERKIAPEREIRLPYYKDLHGKWFNYFNGKTNSAYIIFSDDTNAIIKNGETEQHVTYKIDFSKQPIPLDFYHPDTDKTQQCFVQFTGDKSIWLEWFNKRGDHFTALGFNTTYVRDTITVNNEVK